MCNDKYWKHILGNVDGRSSVVERCHIVIF